MLLQSSFTSSPLVTVHYFIIFLHFLTTLHWLGSHWLLLGTQCITENNLLYIRSYWKLFNANYVLMAAWSCSQLTSHLERSRKMWICRLLYSILMVGSLFCVFPLQQGYMTLIFTATVAHRVCCSLHLTQCSLMLFTSLSRTALHRPTAASHPHLMSRQWRTHRRNSPAWRLDALFLMGQLVEGSSRGVVVGKIVFVLWTWFLQIILLPVI